MSNSGNTQRKWNQLREKMGPGLDKAGEVFGKAGYFCGAAGRWIYKLRKLILALPVVILCVYLAVRNSQQLPEEVGLNLLSDGSYEHMIPRNIAVLGPVMVTALCLLLMMCSRKTLYPWLISLFSLVLPLMLMLGSIFPA